MKIDIIGLLSACSYALDCVEAELLNIAPGHGKRVAYMSVCMAEKLGVNEEALEDLAACSLLHDNALTQYISEEFHNAISENDIENVVPSQLGMHCIHGEKNIKKYPFRTNVDNTILYHHENADGTGPFSKTWNETPLFARLIHLSDLLEVYCRAEEFDENEWKRAEDFLIKNTGTKFDSEIVDAFFQAFSRENFSELNDKNLEEKLWEKFPRNRRDYTYEECRNLADLFAKIIDYKSAFTSKHSLRVAEGAARLSEYMGYDKEKVEKMYLAGALHDIGKVAIGNNILEKPGRLTTEEFTVMKNHAYYTYLILSQAKGFDEIRDWAAFHHEKLDGSGYPFGKKADDLNTQERIMACIDIYEALTEDRPYKEGMSHEKACDILNNMVEKGWIDGEIVRQIEDCFL